MLATALPDSSANGFWENLSRAGIYVGIGIVVWLVLHYFLRFVVKRAMAERTDFSNHGLRWAAPVLRGLDPMMRALDTERRVQRTRTIGSLLNSIMTALIVVIVGFYVLMAFQIDITPLLASVGVLGIAIGFGCQQLIRDFLAGIFITLEDQYGIGDVIQTSEVIGKVEYVGLRITRVLGEDGTLWYLRNGEILRLGNRSKGDYVPPVTDESSESSSATSTTPAPTPSNVAPLAATFSGTPATSTPAAGATAAPASHPASSTPLTNEPSTSSE